MQRQLTSLGFEPSNWDLGQLRDVLF